VLDRISLTTLTKANNNLSFVSSFDDTKESGNNQLNEFYSKSTVNHNQLDEFYSKSTLNHNQYRSNALLQLHRRSLIVTSMKIKLEIILQIDCKPLNHVPSSQLIL